jgi:hypothetical protein
MAGGADIVTRSPELYAILGVDPPVRSARARPSWSWCTRRTGLPLSEAVRRALEEGLALDLTIASGVPRARCGTCTSARRRSWPRATGGAPAGTAQDITDRKIGELAIESERSSSAAS